MEELYNLLKDKLQSMRDDLDDEVKFNYLEVAKMYQFVCFMKQVKELVNWGEKE